MKLSNAQQKIMNYAKAKIDFARNTDYPAWLRKSSNIRENAYEQAIKEGYLKKYWEAERNGIVLVGCNSKTLVKLEEYGLIEIIHDSCGEHYGIDTIKVLNY